VFDAKECNSIPLGVEHVFVCKEGGVEMSTSAVNGARTAAAGEAIATPALLPDHRDSCPHCDAELAGSGTAAGRDVSQPPLPVEVRLHSAITSGSSRSLRFTTANLFPVALLGLILAWTAGSGGLQGEPEMDRFTDAVRDLSGVEVAGSLLLVVLVATLISPFSVQRLRFLEGYWDGSPAAPLARVGRLRHRRRRRRLERAIAVRPRTDKEARRWSRASQQLSLYPDEDRLLPTKLGNVLRAAESQAGQRYGLDTVTIWPRLYPYVPDPLARALRDARTQLDTLVSLCIALLVAGIVLAAALFSDGPWLTLTAAAGAGAWIAYRAATRVAIKYGEGLAFAFDLYRFTMLEGLRFPLPVNLEEELEFNQQLSSFFRSGRPLQGADHLHRYQASAPSRRLQAAEAESRSRPSA
jgi:hypothetical protein